MLARVARLLAVVALVGAAAGCTPSPTPSPTSPAPLTDEEAFAAAEETYRAYVDALNQVDLSDPATFEPVYALTTGEANASARESLTQMNADGWSVSGESSVISIAPRERDVDLASIDICVDVSRVELTDADGVSVVSPDRPDRQAMTVDVRVTARLIERFTPREQSSCG